MDNREFIPAGYREWLMQKILKPEYQGQVVETLGKDIDALLKPERALAISQPELFIPPSDSQPILPPLDGHMTKIALDSWGTYVAQAKKPDQTLLFYIQNPYDRFSSLDVYTTVDGLKNKDWTTQSIRFNKVFVPINIHSQNGTYSFQDLEPPSFEKQSKLYRKLRRLFGIEANDPFTDMAYVLNLHNETSYEEIPLLEQLSYAPEMWTETFNRNSLRTIALTRLSTWNEMSKWMETTRSYLGKPKNIGDSNTLGRRSYSSQFQFGFDYPISIQTSPLQDDDYHATTITSYPVPVSQNDTSDPIGWMLMNITEGDNYPAVRFENSLLIQSKLDNKNWIND